MRLAYGSSFAVLFVLFSCGGPSNPVEELDAEIDARVQDARGDGQEAATNDVQMLDVFEVATEDAEEIFDVQIEPAPDTNCQQTDPTLRLCDVACGANPIRCDDDTCPAGMQCILNGCGRHCVPRGAPCGGSLDCNSSSSCVSRSGGSQCEAAAGECNDSRDCPAGHFCETHGGERQCVDRRIACDPASERSCPFGFQCANPHGGRFICVRAHTRCATPSACLPGSTCGAMIQGANLCLQTGSCATLDDCRGQVLACGANQSNGRTQCQRYGPCNFLQDCAQGMECRNLSGEANDGVSECVEPTAMPMPNGACQTHRDCEPGQICATPFENTYPICITSPVTML